ncbi:signal peptidase II [Pontibacter sp. G13]|uniref:signal peptidase II n=1 Tax=Pontibacter sp. G13 TaxID=3074898 RepID=UPI00288A5B5B|nr:signal peptidase II [Pontibacter sp. G13]WNJ16985.1 signal peptidase II [Pontibacter sp. G13]
MKDKRIAKILGILAIVILNIAADQWSKIVVREDIQTNEIIEVIGHNLILTKVENTGAFLSLGSQLPPVIKDILLMYVPMIALLGVLVMLLFFNTLDKYKTIGLAFVVGGGIGNMYDRLIYGSVTDFLHIDLGSIWGLPLRTGIFNVADMSIMFGMGLILVMSLIHKPDTASSQSEAESEATA